jgi:8-oxo-dGTP pyrophosphatase MutT (NUDIX family)
MQILGRNRRRSTLESIWELAFRLRSKTERVHVAAVCYRLRNGKLEFLLVRTRNGHWTFPKGAVDGDRTNADAAAREAYEEAGVTGRVEPKPFASYLHRKPRQPSANAGVVLVDAHLCEVKQLVTPEEQHRNPTWFTKPRAKRRLREMRTAEYGNEVARVVDRATEFILRTHPEASRSKKLRKHSSRLLNS